MQELKKQGKVIYVIAPKDDFSDKLIELGFHYIPITIDNKGMNPFNDLKLLYQFYKLYKKYNFDLIFHYTIKPNIYGTLAAYYRKIPSIAIVSGAGHAFQETNTFLFHIAKFLYSYSAKKGNGLWFVNSDDRNLFVRLGIINRKRTKLLPGEGVDTSYYYSEQVVSNPSDKTIFLVAARLLWSKGIGLYVESARIIRKKYPNCTFQVLGFLDVENPEAISKQQINQWHDEGVIEYLGYTDDVRPFIANANCFVLPSYYREGTPRSLLEAASMRKPIITTNSVGCKEVVKNGINGFLCEPNDLESLVAVIEKFIQLSDDEREQMGNEGRIRMLQEFDEQYIIKHYVKTISGFQDRIMNLRSV